LPCRAVEKTDVVLYLPSGQHTLQPYNACPIES